MVIDTSAVVAILFGEPEAERFAEAIEQDAVRLMLAASVLEAGLVVESEFGRGRRPGAGSPAAHGGRRNHPLQRGAAQGRLARLSRFRQGTASCWIELLRLLQRCPQHDHGRAPALQGDGFYENRRSGGASALTRFLGARSGPSPSTRPREVPRRCNEPCRQKDISGAARGRVHFGGLRVSLLS